MFEDKETRTLEAEPGEVLVNVRALVNLQKTGALLEELTRGNEEPREEFMDFLQETLQGSPFVSRQLVEGDPTVGRKSFKGDNIGLESFFETYYVSAVYGLWSDEEASIPVVKVEITTHDDEGYCRVLVANWWHYDYL